ncbi:hypothetical protein, partial [Klebsiella michiganensis]|uniref:hypothetical protein n=1 Tax=Klebsiella michiganensis TaxID=1134687 RepID=UPI001E63E1AE
SDFPMSSVTGRANLLLTTSIGGGIHAGIKKPCRSRVPFCADNAANISAPASRHPPRRCSH